VEGAVYSAAASSVQNEIERTFVMFALIFSQPSEACGCAAVVYIVAAVRRLESCR
jgi:hypothetical protein